MRFNIFALLLAAVLLLAALGCDKLNINIPGNVQGQVINAAGQGQGYLSIKLCEATSGKEVQVMTAEDSGTFFFEKVPAGEYIVKVVNVGGSELPCDAKSFRLGTGKTVRLTVTLTSAEAQAAGDAAGE